ncbi:MAG: hypothetical protein ACXVAY_01035 [Mucilaginibacter sp.]
MDYWGYCIFSGIKTFENMEQEYTIGTGTKIFYGALAVGLFGFGLFLFSMKGNADVSPFFYILPLLIIAGSILIFINIIRRKIIIYDDRIICISLFTNKELALADIKGCRIGQKVIYLEPLSNDVAKITIANYIDFGNSDDLVDWARDNFKDLDAADLEDEQNKVLNDTALGATERERTSALKQAKRVATSYNIIGGIIGLGLIAFDNYWSSVLLISYPVIGVLVMATSKGLIKFLSNPKRSVYGNIMIGFFMSSLIMLFKSLDSYNLLQLTNAWLPFWVVAFVICCLLYFTGINKSVEAVKGQFVFMLIMSLIYSFASVIQLNCVFDRSAKKVFHAGVVDRRISHGKHTSYYLTLTPWGPMQQEKEVDVHRWLYNQTRIGDTVEIDFKNGLLNIAWFVVTNK